MTPKDNSGSSMPPRLDMEVHDIDHVEFATADTPRERLVYYVPEARLQAARAESREEIFDWCRKRLKLLNSSGVGHSAQSFGQSYSLMDLLDKFDEKAKQAREGEKP